MTHLDLFSGIGGFALAAKWAGLTTIGFSEIDSYASRVLAKQFPDVPNLGDIRNVRGISADVVTGGFPCQPFSSLGSRAGTADDRYLWPEMLRIASDGGASWIVAENVPRIIEMALDEMYDGLEREGYTAWSVCIPACAVGAPHYRPRLWVVAHRPRRGILGVVGEREAAAGQAPSGRGCEVWQLDGRDSTGAEDGWPAWTGGPRVCGVADGVSARIHAVGNAIVPYIPAQILRWIVEQEQTVTEER